MNAVQLVIKIMVQRVLLRMQQELRGEYLPGAAEDCPMFGGIGLLTAVRSVVPESDLPNPNSKLLTFKRNMLLLTHRLPTHDAK
jgi:hypothetical protein